MNRARSGGQSGILRRCSPRVYWITQEIDWLGAKASWGNLQSLGLVESCREVGEEVSIERRYRFSQIKLQNRQCPQAASIHISARNPCNYLGENLYYLVSLPADRGQITGGILDGPLALDNAIDLTAAKIKKIDSPVAGQADILVVPDLEAGNMLAKSLTFMANADAAGIVLGVRVPIILTSRADSLIARLASCAVASLVAAARRQDASKVIA